MNSIIADAHALIWYLGNDRKLGSTARSFLKEVDNGARVLIVPAVILAEIIMIIEKGRVSLTKPRLSKITTQWHTSDNIRLTSLSPQLVIDSMGLTEMPDIFDRLLVAEARQLDVAVITQDPIIVDSGLVRVIW